MIFDLINVVLIVTALLNFILGLLIYFNGRHKKINKVYAWNILAIISWVLAMIIYRSAPAETSLFWCTILYITPTFIGSSFLYFTYVFPSQKEKKLWWRKLLIFGTNYLVIFFIVLPYLIIEQVSLRPGQEKEIIFGDYYIYYTLYILFFFTFGFIRLIIKYLKSVKLEKAQIIYLFIGYALAANLAFITNLIMPWFGYYFLNWVGQVFTVAMVGFTAYAIIVHNLMDIKLVLRRSFVYLSSLITIILFAISIEYIINRYFYYATTWADVIILISAVSVFPFLRNRYYKIANKYFFSSLYDSNKVIAKISNNLRSSLNIKIICGFVAESLVNTFHTKTVAVLLYDEKKNEYLIQYNHNFNISQQQKFVSDKYLYNKFAKYNQPLVVDEVKKSSIYKKSKETIDLLTQLGVEMLMPLSIKDKNIGLIALGPKESRDIYNNEDIHVLKIIAAQAAVAMQNALLYEESQIFSAKLKKEVAEATAELREANKYLKKIDKAKTEFISITSHQLRTPLTGIQGYLSMLLEGDFGPLNTKLEETVRQLFNNTGHLIRLVNVFLNVSRIELGKLVINQSKVELDDLVEICINELRPGANKKNLSIEFIKVDKKLPSLLIDRDKTKDVILNLISNAVKYTPKGKITLRVNKQDDYVVFSVEDTGGGFSPEEAQTFFKKFSRGRSTKLGIEGSGLGLYIARKIIQAQDGQIWCSSKGINRGSTFSFKLPIKSKKIKK